MNNQNRFIASPALFGLFILIIAGCQFDSGSRVKDKVLVYCSEASPSTFNPQKATSGSTFDATSRQIYDRLLRFTPGTTELAPGLAMAWKVSSDGKVWEFNLRRGVKFHQTAWFSPSRDFNADDVIFSFERQRNNQHPFYHTGVGNYSYFNTMGMGQLIKAIRKLDDYTVSFELTQPDSTFLSMLAMDFTSILSEEYALFLLNQGQKEQLDRLPIGTGPFKLLKYQSDTSIRYARHPEYWQGAPAIEQLVFAITPDASQRFARLVAGECDLVANPLPIHLELADSFDFLKIHINDGLNIAFWSFNTRKPPLDNPLVRKALSLAIDRENIVKTVYGTTATVAHSPLPPAVWSEPEKSHHLSYNPKLARELLRQAGAGENLTIEIWAMPVQRPYNPNAKKMAEMIQHYLLDIGVRSRIITYELGTFLRKIKQGQHQTALMGWSGDIATPENFLIPLLSCNATLTGENSSFWCDQTFDRLIFDAKKAKSEDVRLRLYAKALQKFHQQIPWLPVAFSNQAVLYNTRVKNLILQPTGGIDFSKVILTKPLDD